MTVSENRVGDAKRKKERALEAFRVKARRAKRISDLWRNSLNEWLNVAEHGKNLEKIKRLGKKEYSLRKNANKATEEMYKEWEKCQDY